MVRRSEPQKKIDDRAFPVRVKFKVPHDGLWRISERIREWLAREIAHGDYAWHAAGHDTALYFRTVEDAHRLVTAFPEFERADRTTSPTCQSSAFPFGRR